MAQWQQTTPSEKKLYAITFPLIVHSVIIDTSPSQTHFSSLTGFCFFKKEEMILRQENGWDS